MGHALGQTEQVTAGVEATVLLKCEFSNPLGSVKDPDRHGMIEDAETRHPQKDTVIIDPRAGTRVLRSLSSPQRRVINSSSDAGDDVIERRTLLNAGRC